jgi:uncharacterized protein (DUF1697 family)
MAPFREAMEELGFDDVESYGMSGNLLFNAAGKDRKQWERKIGARLGTLAIVRTRSEIRRIVAADPFAAVVLFLSKAPSTGRRRAFAELGFSEPAPVLRGREVFYVYPVTLRGKRTPFDLERALGVKGTFRSARVVRGLLARLDGSSPGVSRTSRTLP